MEGTVAPPGPVSTNEIVPLCTGSLKVAMTGVPKPIPVAPAAGVVPVTTGGVSVTNDHDAGLVIMVPIKSWAPLTVAV